MKTKATILVALSLLAIFAFVVSFSICKKSEKEISISIEFENSEQAAYSSNQISTNDLLTNSEFLFVDQDQMRDSAGRYDFSYEENKIYNELKDFVISVANGTTTRTSYRIQSDLTFLHYSDLSYLLKLFHYKLLAELPYDFFWYDKTAGYNFNYSNNSSGEVTGLVVSFIVSRDYAYTDSFYMTSPYEVAQAKKALAYAKEIVAKYSHLSDIDKLIAYGNEICSLTKYETDALKEGTPYGDPWQPIHIFDQDSSTNVVCEGYAKGFKLLCDLSDFNNDIECYIVRGDVILDDDPGAHMWNVVNINGANYLVDITWADNGNVLETDRVFLAGGKTDDDHQTHEFQYGPYRTVKYKYRDTEYNLYVQGFLPLEETSYHLHNYVNSHDIFGHWDKCECGSRIFLGVHNFNSEYSYDLTTHWKICECGLASSEEHELSTYPATCQTRATCSVCLKEIGSSFAPHSYTECNTSDKYLYRAATCTSKALYYYSCACGRMNESTFEYGNVLEHVYDRRIVKDSYLAAEATCTTKATYYYSCICGASGNDTFETGGYKSHTFDQCNPSEEYLLLPATCVRAAMYFYSCKCGARGNELFYYGDYSHDCDENGNCSKCGQNITLDNNNDFSSNDDLNNDNENNNDVPNKDETNSSINSQYSNTEYSFFHLLIQFILMLFEFLFNNQSFLGVFYGKY